MVIWVQGCCFRCPGCIAQSMLGFSGGTEIDVAALAGRILETPKIDGVTVSGGEPFMQATGIAALIDRVREKRDMSFMCYTGFRLEELHEQDEPGQIALLARLDILVDGRYLRDQPTRKRWRGSANQRLHLLTSRHEAERATMELPGTCLDMTVGADGDIQWAGITPPGFRQALEYNMAIAGVQLRTGRSHS